MLIGIMIALILIIYAGIWIKFLIKEERENAPDNIDTKEKRKDNQDFIKEKLEKAKSIQESSYKNILFNKILKEYGGIFREEYYVGEGYKLEQKYEIKFQNFIENMIDTIYEVDSLVCTDEGYNNVELLIEEYIKTFQKFQQDEEKEKERIEKIKHENNKIIEKKMINRLNSIKDTLKTIRDEDNPPNCGTSADKGE